MSEIYETDLILLQERMDGEIIYITKVYRCSFETFELDKEQYKDLKDLIIKKTLDELYRIHKDE